MIPAGVSILEEKHMTGILLYLRHHGGCKKTDLYRDVGRGSRMSEKLDILESEGLLTQCGEHTVILNLTDRGDALADALADIDGFLTGRD